MIPSVLSFAARGYDDAEALDIAQALLREFPELDGISVLDESRCVRFTVRRFRRLHLVRR